jgi:hypothetical protein
MAGFVTWLDNLGTIKASRLQLYLSAVNNLYMDHAREPVALGDLVARVRKGFATSQMSILPTLIRVQLHTNVVLLAMVRAEAVRLDILQLGSTDVPQTTIELLRACVANVLCLFYSCVGAEIECLSDDLVTTQQGGIPS